MGLNVVLVLTTSAIIGSITITTGDTLLEDARNTGDENVARSLDASDVDIRMLSGRYLSRVLDGVGKEIRQFLDVPQIVMQQMSEFILMHDPDTITDPDWIDTILRT